jgi:hypothetical protein
VESRAEGLSPPGPSALLLNNSTGEPSIHRKGLAAPLCQGSGSRSGMAPAAYPAAGDTSGRNARGAHDARPS